MRFVLAAMVGCILIAVSPISAKEIGVFNDWSAHVEGNGKSRTCWIYSKPVKHEGRYKKRGPIFSYITHVPREKVANQVQFTAGYTFKKGSVAELLIGKSRFKLFTHEDNAWSEREDAAIVRAMRSGSKMIITGVSSRGTKTKDTYSLSGVSAAHDKISKACKVR